MYARDNMARGPGRQLQLPGDTQVQSAAGILRLLADSTRFRLMWLLCHGEHDVTTLTEAVGAARPAVSQHLAKLRLAGLVSTHRAGRRVHYTSRHGHIRRLVIEALHAADHHVSGAPDHP
jgi:DNA-binding transcriptional ArsR family regulator